MSDNPIGNFISNPNDYNLYIEKDEVKAEKKGFGIKKFFYKLVGSSRYDLPTIKDKILTQLQQGNPNSAEQNDLLRKLNSKIAKYNMNAVKFKGNQLNLIQKHLFSKFRAQPKLTDLPKLSSPTTTTEKLKFVELDVTPTKLKEIRKDLNGLYKDIDSSTFVSTGTIRNRQDFIDKATTWRTTPPIISKSDFISGPMAEHLMRKKLDKALSLKFNINKSVITPMEGALHTFMNPICNITMTGDYKYDTLKKCHSHASYPMDLNESTYKGRQVILSAAIQPDFEMGGNDAIVMKLVEITEKSVEGEQLPKDFRPLWNSANPNRDEFIKNMPAHEEKLQKHMVANLTRQGRLPSLSEIHKDQIMEHSDALGLLEKLISENTDEDLVQKLQNKYVKLNGHVISLEALFHIYIHQVRNEFSSLEATCPQGYVYTIDPPNIFATQIGKENVPILNRLQLLAIKHLKKESPFTNLKVIGFNDFSDKTAINLYKKVFPEGEEPEVISKAMLFDSGTGLYNRQEPYALVIHNNSDAFGQNIETEGEGSSLDGAIGSNSDACLHLKRTRTDLMKNVT